MVVFISLCTNDSVSHLTVGDALTGLLLLPLLIAVHVIVQDSLGQGRGEKNGWGRLMKGRGVAVARVKVSERKGVAKGCVNEGKGVAMAGIVRGRGVAVAGLMIEWVYMVMRERSVAMATLPPSPLWPHPFLSSSCRSHTPSILP